jgi:hypothetical protein
MTNLEASKTIEKHFISARFFDISFYIIYLFDNKMTENELVCDYDFYQKTI